MESESRSRPRSGGAGTTSTYYVDQYLPALSHRVAVHQSETGSGLACSRPPTWPSHICPHHLSSQTSYPSTHSFAATDAATAVLSSQVGGDTAAADPGCLVPRHGEALIPTERIRSV